MAWNNQNWNWSAFGKSIFMGFFTGAASSGLGQVFSATGFWATVGNGALAGAGSGGLTSIINGTNFLEGLVKGGVIGGAVAGISYTIKYYTTSTGSQTSYIDDTPEKTINGKTPVGNRSFARKLYEKRFGTQPGLDKNSIYNRAAPTSEMTCNCSDGVIKYTDSKGKVKTALAVTNSSTIDGGFFKGKLNVHRIYLSHKAFSSREQLAFVMQHELGHVKLYNAGLKIAGEKEIKLESESANKYSDLLDNAGHYHIQEYGTRFLENNRWNDIRSSIPSDVFDSQNYKMYNQQIWNTLKGSDIKININF